MKVKARYRPIGANPFAPRPAPIQTIDAEFPDGTPMEEMEELAKQRTPKGHEFIEVKILDQESQL